MCRHTLIILPPGAGPARLVADEALEGHLHEQVVYVPELVARASTWG